MSLRTCYDDLNNVQQAFGVEYARHSQVFIIVLLTPSLNGSGVSLLQVSLRGRPDCLRHRVHRNACHASGLSVSLAP
jgi:hypothetical protein